MPVDKTRWKGPAERMVEPLLAQTFRLLSCPRMKELCSKIWDVVRTTPAIIAPQHLCPMSQSFSRLVSRPEEAC